MRDLSSRLLQYITCRCVTIHVDHSIYIICLHNTILDFTHTPYKIDIVYVMMLFRQITYITYLTWGKTCVQILFFLKSNVNCHLPVLIISRILIYINDSYDVLIWSDTQILCMCILNPRTISIIIIKFQF